MSKRSKTLTCAKNANPVFYKYWPKHKPIPDGWVECGNMHLTHHGEYCILIKRVVIDADH